MQMTAKIAGLRVIPFLKYAASGRGGSSPATVFKGELEK
jgi:hypothetical protein